MKKSLAGTVAGTIRKYEVPLEDTIREQSDHNKGETYIYGRKRTMLEVFTLKLKDLLTLKIIEYKRNHF
jgi:hypothetical protein